MSTLNLSTVELVSTLRAAPSNGATNSQDYNDSWTESLADLASISGFLNDILIPMMNGLISNIQDSTNSTPHGLEGRYIFSDTSDTTSLFFDSLSSQSLSIADSFRILNGIVTTVQTAIANINVEVTALQAQLSATNQNDISQALQNFAASLQSLTAQVNSNTQQIENLQITFQTNDVQNSIQNKLDLKAGANVTLTEVSGVVTIAAANKFDMVLFAPGVGINGQILVRFGMTRASFFPAGAAGAQATAVTAATASTTYTLKKNGTPFATVVFPPAGVTGVWNQASNATFALNDIFEADGPALADATIANVGLTLPGIRL